AFGLEMLPDRIRDLRREPLLHLQSPSEAVENTCQLADTHHPITGQIGDRRLADDRREMVFAMRLERNVLEEDDLVIAADFLEGPAQVDRGILLVAARIFLPRPRNAARGVEQSLSVGIVARPADQCTDGLAYLGGNFAVGPGIDEIAVFRLAML